MLRLKGLPASGFAVDGIHPERFTREDETVEIRGKYVVIWKMEGREWVVAVDIDNTDHPL
ncbi:hypothetical protein [Paraburkholderia caffeinilytica]|uniref:hypothetical protein n=1 Tax=Paraburkholderia caffeinilytica TaxID=1761016 RepID=UPI003DA02F51